MNVNQAVGILEAELLSPSGMLYELRRGRGIKQEVYDRIVACLRVLQEDWRGKDLIPKSTVGLIYWIDRAIEECSYAYPKEEGEALRNKAMEVSEILTAVFGDPV